MDYFWYCYVFLLGSIIGSFLNVCILRLPAGQSVVTGRSHCPHCGHTLSFFEMIPVFSFLLLRGRCKNCHARISIQYPLVEFLTGTAYLLSVLRFGFSDKALLLCVFASVLIVLSGIDLHTMELPDSLQLWLLGLAILHLVFQPSFWFEGLLGFFIVSVPMLVLSLFTDGFGGGDIKLCAVCGLFLGFRLVLTGFVAACILAAIAGLFLLLSKKADRHSAFPFGPFLSAGFLFSALYGDSVLAAYLSLF